MGRSRSEFPRRSQSVRGESRRSARALAPFPNLWKDVKKKPMYLHQAPGGLAPLINRAFDARFKSDAAYRATLPDMMAEHARSTRGAYATPHAQRSKARVRVVLANNRALAVEDLQRHCAHALKTETQVMVKREDEQAFAELNGAYIKFVEDAARLLYQELADDSRIADFQVACSHLESLHSHDAVSVICKGVKGGLRADFSEFQSLVC